MTSRVNTEVCEEIMDADDIAHEFAIKAGLKVHGKEEPEWKIFILLVAYEDGIEALVEAIQKLYPSVIIMGGLCQKVYNRPSIDAATRGGHTQMFEGEGIAGIAISGNVPFKPLIAYPFGPYSEVRWDKYSSWWCLL
jgi:small ligand-binding sensory domain FIST